jgi:alkaline phosphatase
MLTRRSFLGKASLLAASTIGFPHIAQSANAFRFRLGQKPRHIIHLVSDGMSWGTLTSADLFSQRTRQRGLTWLRLYTDPAARHGMMGTRSLNSLVTDSAAASSAWGTGSRVANGVLNMLPDGRLLKPLFELFAAQSWKRGLVTTAEITHATPAGFAVAVKTRDNAQDIAAQYLVNKVEILLGGGRPFFEAARRRDRRNLFGEFAQAGYSVVRNTTELTSAPRDTKLLGTFASSHLPYTIDHQRDEQLRSTVPTLAQLTQAALVRLERHRHFILQVEGARIDHAAHNSDAAAAVRDQIALDEALDLCLEFQKRHPDTLLVLTTDHANSNLGLNGMGGSYRHSSQRFAALAETKVSLPVILTRLERAGQRIRVPAFTADAEDRLDVPDPMAAAVPAAADGEDSEDSAATTNTTTPVGPRMTSAYRVEPKAIIEIVADATGYKMSERRAVLFARVLAGEYRALYDQMNSPITQLGQLLANHTGIGWTGNTHTSDYCPILAIGPGAERFTGFVENTEVFDAYTKLAGIDYKNPSAPLIADSNGSLDVENVAAYAHEEECLVV